MALTGFPSRISQKTVSMRSDLGLALVFLLKTYRDFAISAQFLLGTNGKLIVGRRQAHHGKEEKKKHFHGSRRYGVDDTRKIISKLTDHYGM
jgi:hypothetical protein